MKRILILGRFQPPHRGHLSVIRNASKEADEVIVVVGSAQESFTATNPFTAGERIEMLRAALAEARIENVVLVPVLDIHRHAQWVAHVESLVPPFEEVLTNNPLTRLLFTRAGYTVRASRFVDRAKNRGTRIREQIAKGVPPARLVPRPVAEVLRRIDAKARLRSLQEEANA